MLKMKKRGISAGLFSLILFTLFAYRVSSAQELGVKIGEKGDRTISVDNELCGQQISTSVRGPEDLIEVNEFKKKNVEGSKTIFSGVFMNQKRESIQYKEVVEIDKERVNFEYELKAETKIALDTFCFHVVLFPFEKVKGGKFYLAKEGQISEYSLDTLRNNLKLAEEIHYTLLEPFSVKKGDWVGWTLKDGKGIKFLFESNFNYVTLIYQRERTPAQDGLILNVHLQGPPIIIKQGEILSFKLSIKPFSSGLLENLKTQIDVSPTKTEVEKFEKLELNVNLLGKYDNPFNPDEVSVKAVFTSPSNKEITIPGFFYQDYKKNIVPRNERLQHIQNIMFFTEALHWKNVEGNVVLYLDDIKLKNSKTGEILTIKDGEEIDKWSAFNENVEIGREERTVKDGTSSLRITIYVKEIKDLETAGWGGFGATRGLGDADFSKYDELSFWIYPEVYPLPYQFFPGLYCQWYTSSTKEHFVKPWGGPGFGEMCGSGSKWVHLTVDLNEVVPADYLYLTEEGRPFWKVRFTPDEVGTYHYQVLIKDKNGERESKVGKFNSLPSQRHGFIRGSVDDFRYFQFDNGKPYFPMGENYCYPKDKERHNYYEEAFAQLSKDGGNFARVFYWCNLMGDYMGKGQLERYDLETLWRFDKIFELAEEKGIYIMDDQSHIAAFGIHWPHCSYNKKIGGPCTTPSEFWTNKEAREYYKKFLHYRIARYSAYSSLFTWELWNEITFVPVPGEVLTAWQKEMASYIKENDPFHHPVTTSFGGGKSAESCEIPTLELPEIDIAQTHEYTPHIEYTVVSVPSWKIERYRKPHFFGETGFYCTGDPLVDKEGMWFHNIIWASSLAGNAGATPGFGYVPFYHCHLKPLAEFVKDIPWTEAKFQKAKVKFPEDLLNIVGLQGENLTLLWIQNKDHTWLKHTQEVKSSPIPSQKIEIEGLKDGRYTLELWDTYKGGVVKRELDYAKEGKLTFNTPPIEKDIAYKIYITI